MREQQPFLRVENICKSFSGVAVLKNVNFELEEGKIHALIGENGAGKSTLMKILLGIYHAESGTVYMKGKACHFKSPQDALENGIAMIHQEISLVPNFDVAENVFLGREKEFSSGGVIDKKERYRRTQELIDKYDLQLDPHAVVRDLKVAEMQLVELVRAVSYDADLIIMDEPTSALSNIEIEILFNVMRDLTSKGKTIIFISHKLEELFAVCDNITVLCDGRSIFTCKMSETTTDAIIRAMVGRDISDVKIKTETTPGEILLECRNMSGDKFHNVSLHVRAGEVVGLCGLMGAGRTEILNGIFGIAPIREGSLVIDGTEYKSMHVKKAIKAGVAMVNEDRLRMGAIHKQSVRSNMSVVVLKRFGSLFGWIRAKKETRDCDTFTKLMNIKMQDYSQLIDSLSGGNQQKVIIGRWLMSDPKVMLLDEPTRGIDVGAKTEVHKHIDMLAGQGRAILMASSELPELLALCDRILVVREGRIVADVERARATQDVLMNYALGVLTDDEKRETYE